MAVVPLRKSVDDTVAKRLDSTPDSPQIVGAQSQPGYLVAIKNTGPDSCFLGGDATVTTSVGYEFASGGEMFFTMFGDDAIFARCAAGKTSNIQVFQVGV